MLALQALPEWVCVRQARKLSQQLVMAAEREAGLDPLLDRHPAKLFQPLHFVTHEVFVGDFGVC